MTPGPATLIGPHQRKRITKPTSRSGYGTGRLVMHEESGVGSSLKFSLHPSLGMGSGLRIGTATILRKQTNTTLNVVKIQILNKYKLLKPLDAIVDPDDGGFIARSIDLPLYGYGDDPTEAVQALKNEIESLYDDLMTDDNFTDIIHAKREISYA